ncbi:hypothetical protein AB0J83_27920 [Actinoplanes sp. NPDC049596]
MARHAQPEGRFSLRRGLRFEPLEAAIAVVSFLGFIIGLPVVMSEARTINNLRDSGLCVEAQVEKAGWHLGSKLRSSADLTYAIGGQTFRGALHYQSRRPLRERSAVRICTDRNDPTIFALDSSALIGDSTGLWLRTAIGVPVSILGVVVFGLVLGKHQWRFTDADEP